MTKVPYSPPENSATTSKSNAYWPNTNKEIERFTRILSKVIKCVIIERLKKDLNSFFLHYRKTTNTVTGTPPSEMLFPYKASRSDKRGTISRLYRGPTLNHHPKITSIIPTLTKRGGENSNHSVWWINISKK